VEIILTQHKSTSDRYCYSYCKWRYFDII